MSVDRGEYKSSSQLGGGRTQGPDGNAEFERLM